MSESLSSLYKNQLRSLNPRLPQVIEHLVNTEILTRTEASRLLSTSGQFSQLCQQLASKGTEKREEILAEIDSFIRGQRRNEGDAVCAGMSSRELQLHPQHTLNGRGAAVDESGREGKSGSSRKRTSTTRTAERGGTKREELQLAKHTEMDQFIAQFYTFICQILQSLSDGRQTGWSHDRSHDPLISEWLQADLTADQVLSYFPSYLRKSLGQGHGGTRGRRDRKFQTVRLSELLGHFKSYVRKNEAEARERKLLAGKSKLLQSLTERNAHLEEQVLVLNRPEIPDSHHLNNGHPPHLQNGTEHPTQPQRRERSEKERREREEVAHMKNMLQKSEARNKELVSTNKQWAVEAGERASEITVLQLQLQDTREEIQRLKETQHAPSTTPLGGGANIRGVSDTTRSEFSSYSDAVAEREKQLKQERDTVVGENERLRAELEEERRGREEDRDEMEDLRDRVANLRVQAQSKMPTVKEMAALTSENRQLRERVERDRAQMETLIQKLKTLQDKYSSSICNGVASEGHLPRETDKSGILIEPLANEYNDVTRFNRVGNSPITTTTAAGAGKQTPIFFDDTPLAPRQPFQRDTQAAHHLSNGHSTSSTNTDPSKHTRSVTTKSASNGLKNHSGSENPFSPSPRFPPPPNQPEAVILSGPKLGCGVERKCPTCSTVFLMLGEGEFQSHVARCQLPKL